MRKLVTGLFLLSVATGCAGRPSRPGGPPTTKRREPFPRQQVGSLVLVGMGQEQERAGLYYRFVSRELGLGVEVAHYLLALDFPDGVASEGLKRELDSQRGTLRGAFTGDGSAYSVLAEPREVDVGGWPFVETVSLMRRPGAGLLISLYLTGARGWVVKVVAMFPPEKLDQVRPELQRFLLYVASFCRGEVGNVPIEIKE